MHLQKENPWYYSCVTLDKPLHSQHSSLSSCRRRFTTFISNGIEILIWPKIHASVGYDYYFSRQIKRLPLVFECFVKQKTQG